MKVKPEDKKKKCGKTPEDAAWFWTKYCFAAIVICAACIIILPGLTKRAAVVRDQIYGVGSAELAILRTGLGYDAQLYSLKEQLEELQAECEELEGELAKEGVQ